MKLMHKTAATAAVAGMLVTGAMAPANAAPPVLQEGLVNVSVGDVTILEDVNLGVAANIAANICDVDVAILLAAIEDTGTTSCDAGGSGQTITLDQA